jgi:uncharacterized membrane protein YadS
MSKWAFTLYFLSALELLPKPLSLADFRNQGMQHCTPKILQASIVVLGFGMNLEEVITASKSGFYETLLSVSGVMIGGILLGKLLKTEKNIALLISTVPQFAGEVQLQQLRQY